MRGWIAILVALWATGLPAQAADRPGGPFNWKPWRYLPVQDGGRRKPLDTLARETARMLGNWTSLKDPRSQQKLDCVAFYLAMLFDWQGWQKAGQTQTAIHEHMGYFDGHQPDRWDHAPLIRIGSLQLQEALGLGKGQKYVSPFRLSQAVIRDPSTGKKAPFGRWAQTLIRSKQQGFSRFEKKALDLASKLRMYQEHRMGQRLHVLPIQGSPHEQWMSVAQLLGTDFDDQSDPTGKLRKAKELFGKARAAYLAGDGQAFARASGAFIATVRQLGPQLGPYPQQTLIRLEVAYNRLAPFRLAWMCSLAALVCLLPGLYPRWKVLLLLGAGAFAASLMAMLAGFCLRVVISGRAPVTNLYESVVFVAFGAMVLSLLFVRLYRKQSVLAAAAAVATVALLVADCCPSVLDPSIRPLVPVLRSNFWLAVHVITIMLSYAAFALALAVSDVTLGYYLVRPDRQEAIQAQSHFTLGMLKVGVLLLTVGTFLGAAWADYSWGRFWGWDPKEVWALITLLSYLALLHARSAGWVQSRGLAALSVICFALVVMAWYGVNMLGSGLHKYGLGGGGQYFVWGAVALHFLYVGAALVRPAPKDEMATGQPTAARDRATRAQPACLVSGASGRESGLPR